MGVLNAIKTRWSNYKYKNKEIPKEVVEDILNCGRLAPSTKNRQPWYFVVTSGKTKTNIIKVMKDKVKSITNKSEMKRIGIRVVFYQPLRRLKKFRY